MKRHFLVFVSVLLLSGLIFGQSIKDYTLEECIKIALQNNPQLKSAKFQYEISKSEKLSSWARILPNITGSASSGKSIQGPMRTIEDVQIVDPVTGEVSKIKREATRPKQTYKSHGISITYNQNIFDFGGWWYQIKQGNSNRDAYYYNYLNEVLNTIALVKQRYYEMIKEMGRLNVFKDALKVAEEQLAKTESMYEVGSAAQADVYKAKVQVGNEKINIINQERNILIAENNLNIAMGRKLDEHISVVKNIPIDKTFDFTLDELKNKAKSNNPNLKSIKKNLEVNEMGIKIAKSGLFPTLGYSISYSRNNSIFDEVWGNFNRNYSWSYGVGISYTFFDGFRRKTNIERQEQNTKIAKENLIITERQLMSEVEQTYNNIVSYLELLEIYENNVKAAEEDLRLAREKYNIGAGTILEVNDAQKSLREARYSIVSTQYDLMVAKAKLNSLLGEVKEEYLLTLEVNY